MLSLQRVLVFCMMLLPVDVAVTTAVSMTLRLQLVLLLRSMLDGSISPVKLSQLQFCCLNCGALHILPLDIGFTDHNLSSFSAAL